MKVIVCGGRFFADWKFLFQEMDRLHSIHFLTTIIEGGQRTLKNGEIIGGADYWASQWANARGVNVIREDANWSDLSQPDSNIKQDRRGGLYDSKAGPRRNRKMITAHKPDAVISFSGGRGTQNMLNLACEHGLEIISVQP